MNNRCREILKALEDSGDVVVWWKFEFPVGFDNGLRLKDFLLDEVEEKYYIAQDKVDKLLENLKNKDSLLLDVSQAKREGKPREYNEYSPTLNARDYKEPRLINEKTKSMKVGNINPSGRGMNGNVYDSNSVSPTLTTNKGEGIKVLCEPNELKLFTNLSGGKWDKIHESARRVYDENEIAPTIPTCGGGNIEPKVAVKMCAMRGRYNENGEIEQQLEIQKDEISNSLTTVQKDSMVLEYDYRIRKLTPQECWRLMGFTDEDYWNARKALEKEFYKGKDRSNSQMYKMAGNSICVPVLEAIFKNLLHEYIN